MHPWFDLNNDAAYQDWRAWKLSQYPATLNDLRVPISNPLNLMSAEHRALQDRLNRYNMAIYAGPKDENRHYPRELGAMFGLKRVDANLGAEDDGITEIEVKDDRLHKRYIPYGNTALSWHVDGYYNPPGRWIRGMMLHCVRPAAEGGENALMDVEMAYIFLRDQNPDWIRALSAADVFTIPANVVDGRELRAAETGPVFSIDEQGDLHMRYSARKRNIEWKGAPTVSEAVAALEAVLSGGAGEQRMFRGTLAAGEGLICNNVLHNRAGFRDSDESPRLLYRLRYLDRVPTRAMGA